MVPYGSPEDIGVIQLAWLGDSVWELHQRLRHVHFPLKSKDLHLSVVNEVKAKSQSKSLSQIEHLLNSNEMDLIRRATNKTKTYPKSSHPSIYSRATGFETLIGWLFLKDPQRLSKLFEYLELEFFWYLLLFFLKLLFLEMFFIDTLHFKFKIFKES